MTTLPLNEIIMLVMLSILTLQSFFLYKSIPHERVQAILDKLTDVVNITPTQLDNAGLEALKEFYNEYKNSLARPDAPVQEPQPAPQPYTVTVSSPGVLPVPQKSEL